MSGNGDLPSRVERQTVQRGLGLGIQRLRRRRGWSQGQLARRLKVTRHCISRWERGVSAPALEDVVALLEVLEVTFEELVFGSPVPVPSLPAEQRSEAAMYLEGFLRAIGWARPSKGKVRRKE